MTFAPDGRLFISQQDGALRIVKNGLLLPTPFVTLPVNASGERGLLGVAFDPSFSTNGFVYIYYTATSPTVHNRVSRFTAVGDVAQVNSEVVVLELDPLGPTNHNGGAIHFGNDGKLYVAVGDNGNKANAQSLGTRFGKMLRINADGTIPDDNPFPTTTGVNRAIWALGLRNPYTFAVQAVTGRMLINDVGELAWEEVNEGLAGANYGWPDTEGPTTAPGFTAPLYAYDHDDGCAISGGAFHNLLRAQFPLPYWGTYFIGDFCGGWIRSVKLGNGTFTDFASGISSLVDVAAASDGSLYYLARGSGSDTGTVNRISYAATTPRIDLTANGGDGPVTLAEGGSVLVSASFDPGPVGPINAHVYIGLSSPLGAFWVSPQGTWVTAAAPAYSGSLGSFQSATLVNLTNAGGLPPGPYWCLMIVVPVGSQSTTYSDMVLTIVPEAVVSVNGFERRPEEHLGFFVARRPPAFAVDALPGDLEKLVDQHNRFGAPAAGTHHPMLVEHVLGRKASLHRQLLGSYEAMR
jgi:glucose/arabinose dehydrogenase